MLPETGLGLISPPDRSTHSGRKGRQNPVHLENMMSKMKNDWFEPTCFMCHDFFVDPVTLDCGHDFCHACILHSWKECEVDTVCPRCKEPVLRTNLKSNDQLAKSIRLAKWVGQGKHLFLAEGRKICKEHWQAVKYFCKDHLVSFCSGCETSKEHLAHNAVSASEAARGYKVQVLSRMLGLAREAEHFEMYQSDMEEQWQNLIEQVEEEKQRMMDQFKEIHQRITEQCNSRLSRMEDAVEEILLKKSEHMAEISREYTKVQDKFWEMQKKYGERPIEFLQTIGSTLEKCKNKKVGNLVPFPAAVKREIWELQDFIALLPVAMKEFEAVLEYGSPQEKDPDADFLKHLKLGGIPQTP